MRLSGPPPGSRFCAADARRWKFDRGYGTATNDRIPASVFVWTLYWQRYICSWLGCGDRAGCLNDRGEWVGAPLGRGGSGLTGCLVRCPFIAGLSG